MNDVIRDLRYSARMLVKNPVFTIAAVLTLALGIGLNAATFSAVHGILLRPLGGADSPEELVQIVVACIQRQPTGGGGGTPDPITDRGGLSKASGGRDEGQFAVQALVQLLKQAMTRDQFRSSGRDIEFGGEKGTRRQLNPLC